MAAYEGFSKFIEYLRQIQIKRDNDVFMCVSGEKGAGKSSFALQTARFYVDKYFNESYFSLKKYTAYNNDEVFIKMNKSALYSPLIADEAVRFAWTREWYKSEHKELIKLGAQVRTKKLIFMMNIPRFVWLDKAYREGLIDMWVWLHNFTEEEGEPNIYAIVFEPDKHQAEKDPWHLNRMVKSRGKIDRIGMFTDIEQVLKIVDNHPCFHDYFKFPPLPAEIYKHHLEVRKRAIFQGEQISMEQKQLGKVMSYNLCYNWDKLIAAVEQSRYKRPNDRIISKVLLNDPVKNQNIAVPSTVFKWIDEMKKKVPQQVQEKINEFMEEAPPEEEEKEIEMPK